MPCIRPSCQSQLPAVSIDYQQLGYGQHPSGSTPGLADLFRDRSASWIIKEFRLPCSRTPMLHVSLQYSKTGSTRARNSLIFVLLHKYRHLQTLRLSKFITEAAIPRRLLISGKDRPPLPIALPRYTKLSTKETGSPCTTTGGGRLMFSSKKPTQMSKYSQKYSLIEVL